MYPTHAGPIGYTKLTLWPHKYKVGHIDLILIKHHISQIHLKILNFHMCHITFVPIFSKPKNKMVMFYVGVLLDTGIHTRGHKKIPLPWIHHVEHATVKCKSFQSLTETFVCKVVCMKR